MLSDLLTKDVLIKRRSPGTELDDYGNEVDEETTIETVGELQQAGRSEREQVISATDWMLFLPPGITFDTNDVVEVDSMTFEVSGGPWVVRNPTTGEDHHIEATLQRTSGEA